MAETGTPITAAITSSLTYALERSSGARVGARVAVGHRPMLDARRRRGIVRTG
jgi:hypothetical protein